MRGALSTCSVPATCMTRQVWRLRPIRTWGGAARVGASWRELLVLHEEASIRDSPGLRASAFVGRMGSTVAPAQGVTPLVGADLSPESPQNRTGSVPLDPSYEHQLDS